MHLDPPVRIKCNAVMIGVSAEHKIKFFKVALRRKDKCTCYPMEVDRKQACILSTLKLKNDQGELGQLKYAFIVHPDMTTSVPQRNSLSSKYVDQYDKRIQYVSLVDA